MRSALILFTLLTLLTGWGHDAAAQAFGGESKPAQAPVLKAFGQDNPHLRAMLDLQYQMQLLKRMIERERAANDMIRAAVAIDIANPAAPAPDRAICRQLPANIVCAQAWSDLYPGFGASAGDAPADIALMGPMPALPVNATLDRATSPPKAKAIAAPAAPPAQGLFWTDITCLQGACSAVISPDPGNPRARYRVSLGEKLPDGATVTAIGAAGVTLQRDGKTVRLEPAPRAS